MDFIADAIETELDALRTAARAGAADRELVAAIAAGVPHGDADTWLREMDGSGRGALGGRRSSARDELQ